MERKHWVDLLKGVSMLVVLIAHTDIYYTGRMLGEYNYSLLPALLVFFTMSGYLMYHEHKEFDLYHKLTSIFKSLVVPYFIFMTVIYVPKHLAHGDSIDPMQMLIDIVWRGESWFITALAMAEIILSLVIKASRGRSVWILLCGFAGFIISALMSKLPEMCHKLMLWHIDNGLQALFFLACGYLYHKYEECFSPLRKRPFYVVMIMLVPYFKSLETVFDFKLILYPTIISYYSFLVYDYLICTLTFIELFKLLPRCKALEWVGQHSLVYYFLCGGVPLTVSMVANKMGYTYDAGWINLVPVILIVCAVTTGLVYLIYRYVPFVTGKF